MSFILKDEKVKVKELKVYKNYCKFYVIHSVGPISLHQGDMIDFRYQLSLTNDEMFPIGVGYYVTLTDSSSSTAGTKLIQAVMTNITPQQHHLVVSQNGFFEAKSEYKNVYVNVVVYAVSCNATSQTSLPIHEGYGNLSVKIEPNYSVLYNLLKEQKEEIERLRSQVNKLMTT